MNKDLKNELIALLSKYPDLKDSKLFFGDNKIKHFIKSEDEQQKDIPLCKQREPDLNFLTGSSPKAQVQKSPIHGYGVIAIDVIEEGEIIEESKLLKLDYRSKFTTDGTLKDYVWANTECDCIECKVNGPFVYLALGFGSLYNHADECNTKQKLDFKKETFKLWAKKRIEKGEEILVTYGDRYFLIRNFWKKINETKALENVMRNKKLLEEKAG